MSEEKLIRKGWKGWLVLYSTWIAFSIFNVGNYLIMQYMAGQKIKWHDFLLHDQIFIFIFIASLCPLVYRYSYRFPFTWSKLPLALIFHSLMLMVICIGATAITILFLKLIESPEMDLMVIAKNQLARRIRISHIYSCLITYFFVYFSMTAIRWGRQRKEQKERAKKLEIEAARLESQLVSAKLQTLKRQLHPHFLFNALNSISSLVENKRNDQAFKTIAQLSDLLRTSIELPETQMIPLHQEMELIRKYLSIELIRFSDRLRVSTDIDPQCAKALVPALILQPLVENCIRHAVAKQHELVSINITAQKQDLNVSLEIRNDRSVLPQDWDLKTHASVGLTNVMERLKISYGSRYEFDIYPDESAGVCVKLVFPFKIKKTKKPE